jgi:hypothetical protein
MQNAHANVEQLIAVAMRFHAGMALAYWNMWIMGSNSAQAMVVRAMSRRPSRKPYL